MGSSQYTKGDWKTAKDYQNRTQIIAVGGDKPSQEGMQRNICQLSTRSLEQEEANAHLISAAPEMYEALKGIKELTKGYTEMPKDIILKAVEKALAKAEGK